MIIEFTAYAIRRIMHCTSRIRATRDAMAARHIARTAP